MASTTFDIIVIGCGVMGVAACRALAKRGARVLGLYKFGVPNAMGSSHGQTRMTRSAYFEHPDYVPLIKRANVLWREIEQDAKQKLLYLTGALYIGAPDSELISGSTQAAEQHGLEYKMLTRSELSSRYPQFRSSDDSVGLWERDAGYILAEPAVIALADQALRLGAEIHGNEEVVSWFSTAAGITVKTNCSTYSAGNLVICGGPWSAKVIGRLGIDLKVTRQTMGWVWPKRPELFTPERFLPFAVDDNHGSLHYGFPLLPGAVGLKVAWHAQGSVTEPDSLKRQVSEADEKTFRPFLESILPDAAGSTLDIRICMYTNSPDSHFILDCLPDADCVTIGCGFSGHGFKFAPVIGEALADLAMNGESPLPIKFLGLERFS
jgi:sarcosine oxidase